MWIHFIKCNFKKPIVVHYFIAIIYLKFPFILSNISEWNIFDASSYAAIQFDG